MLKNIVFKLALLLVLLIKSTITCYSQAVNLKSERLMFYNVENLFDIYDDPLTNDDEFLPGGLRRWTLTRYNMKINSLYKTIVAAGDLYPPSIVAFCEVENRKVLEDLVYGTYLSKYSYRIVHEDSPDQRGIDVSLIYRNDCVKVIGYEYWIPSGMRKEQFTSRSILYTRLLIKGDTIHLIVNHWPSRRGGVLAGESLRMKIAAMVRTRADSINRSCSTGARIIILGDFNSSPDDQEIKSLTSPEEASVKLVNLSERMTGTSPGTYRYMGTWEMIDQVIVSDYLLNCSKGLFADDVSLKIFSPDFLLMKDPKFPGFTPFSTFRGYKYQGGFSDHLPILLDIKVR